MASRVERVEFFFDSICPWAYQTSLWIREVRRLTGLAIGWRFASLEEFNRPEGKKHPWEREIGYSWTPLEVAALLRRRSMDACDAWYLACGRTLHEEGRRPHEVEVARELLASIGESPSVWDEALADATTHGDVRADRRPRRGALRRVRRADHRVPARRRPRHVDLGHCRARRFRPRGRARTDR
jgi:protein-disulfide isomerase-like protein with CxxC motif